MTTTFSITKIRELVFILNESGFNGDLNSPVRIDFQHAVVVNEGSSILSFILKCIFTYSDNPSTILVEHHLQNDFIVEDLKQFLHSGKNITLPQPVWIDILEVSVSHSRAYLTQRLAGTNFQHKIIPIVDAKAMADQIFNTVQMPPKKINTHNIKKTKAK